MTMRRGALSVQGLSKAYGELQAVRDVVLDVAPGEFLTLLGPSGCGKTTLLRLIGGFEAPDAGSVRISGADVTALPPYRRPLNTVFQHYALFPHRDVAGNVAFGLETAGRTRAEIAGRVDAALELVRLSGLGGRRIDQLSGGQRQRVALARALVLEPEVLLLDEPLAALDLKLRQQMRIELKNLQERLRLTFVFVTHDQDEALVMSDRIAVMNRGRVEQVGPPEALYERPATRFVADFLAVRNLWQAEVVEADAAGARLRTAGGLLLESGAHAGWRAGSSVCIGVRPERVSLEPPPPPAPNIFSGTIEDEIYLGERTDWVVRIEGELLTVSEGSAAAARRRRGDAVRIHVPREAVLALATPESGGEPA